MQRARAHIKNIVYFCSDIKEEVINLFIVWKVTHNRSKIFSSKKRALSLAILFVLILNFSVFAYAINHQAAAVASDEIKTVVNPNSLLVVSSESASAPIEKKSHAPEPGTLILFGSGGIIGAFVRFARQRYRDAKRAFDVVFSAVGLILSLPIVLVVSALIKLTSKGPVLYRQKRVGENGSDFYIFKLRTMVQDAEKGCGAVWAKENDNRITFFGRILRKTHIDEIPQLINVLRGEMSIIGPRPERPEFVKDLSNKINDYPKRLSIKPGITGLAQVWHKYDETIEDVKKKVKYDLLYIRKMCWMVDFRILLRTCLVVVTGKGAR